MPIGVYSRVSVRIRFMRKVKKVSRGCWLWQGSCFSHGYGRVKYKKRIWLAHRLSYTIFVSKIPFGKCVLHRCDVKLCVRPSHFFLGTQADNVGDMVAKGRDRKAQGEDKPNSKLNWWRVAALWRLHFVGVGPKRLAEKFGVSKSTIEAVLYGKTWKT